MKTQILSFQCVLKNRLGQVLSESYQSDILCHPDIKGPLSDLALGLSNVTRGERRKIEIKAERAYGLYDPDLYGVLFRSELSRGDSLKIGDTLSLYSAERKSSLVFRVVDCTPDTVCVDANHPFAGQDLLFEVEIIEARESREDDFLENDSEKTLFERILN